MLKSIKETDFQPAGASGEAAAPAGACAHSSLGDATAAPVAPYAASAAAVLARPSSAATRALGGVPQAPRLRTRAGSPPSSLCGAAGGGRAWGAGQQRVPPRRPRHRTAALPHNSCPCPPLQSNPICHHIRMAPGPLTPCIHHHATPRRRKQRRQRAPAAPLPQPCRRRTPCKSLHRACKGAWCTAGGGRARRYCLQPGGAEGGSPKAAFKTEG
jgi:hypothetical protein